MMKHFVKPLIGLVAALALAAALFFGVKSLLPEKVEPTVLPSVTEVLSEKLENCSELSTASYLCTCVKPYSSSLSWKGWKIPLTVKSFTISYDGIVKAGIKDLSKVQISQKDDSTILVVLPKMEITNQTLNFDSLQVYDESHNILNQITVEDVNTVQSELEKEMVENAIAYGLLDNAYENAKEILSAMLSCAESENYTFEFSIQQ